MLNDLCVLLTITDFVTTKLTIIYIFCSGRDDVEHKSDFLNLTQFRQATELS